MATYEVTYSCGHTGTVRLYGKNAERNNKLEWYENCAVCPDCYKAEIEAKREKERAEAEKNAAENSLPALTGSAKQIAWALKLRDDFFKRFEEYEAERMKAVREALKKAPERREEAQKYVDTLERIRAYFAGQTASRYWIDLRDEFWYFSSVIDDAAKKVKEAVEKEERESTDDARAAIAEATLYPEEEATKDIAEFKEADGAVEMASAKNETIIKTVKSLGWTWDKEKSVWQYKLSTTSGSASDRIAEAGNALLRAGVPVRIFDEEARKNAVSGNFEPRHTRWILRDGENIKIGWIGRVDEDVFSAAKSLPHAKYENGMIKVSAEHYEKIRAFAENNDFKISESAANTMLKAEMLEKSVRRVDPREPDEYMAKREMSPDSCVNPYVLRKEDEK